MSQREVIEKYIDKINKVFLVTKDFNLYNKQVDSNGDEIPRYVYDSNYQFANINRDINNILDKDKVFSFPDESRKFVSKLNLLCDKNLVIDKNHIRNVFRDKNNKEIDQDIFIDTFNKTLKYERTDKVNNIPHNIFKEYCSIKDDRTTIYKENDKLETDGYDSVATNNRYTAVYKENKYLESAYERNIIKQTNGKSEVEVTRINDYKLANGVRITKKTTTDNEEFYIFYNTELDVKEKSEISSLEFEQLLSMRDDIYGLENNDVVYYLKHIKHKNL